jgi:hypothetical protein
MCGANKELNKQFSHQIHRFTPVIYLLVGNRSGRLSPYLSKEKNSEN